MTFSIKIKNRNNYYKKAKNIKEKHQFFTDVFIEFNIIMC